MGTSDNFAIDLEAYKGLTMSLMASASHPATHIGN